MTRKKGNFTPSNALNAHQRQAIGNYKPREKQAGEAGQRAINLMTLPTYQPARDLGARKGIAQ